MGSTLLMGTSLLKGFGPPPNPKVPEDADYQMTTVATLDFSATVLTTGDFSPTDVTTGDFQAT